MVQHQGGTSQPDSLDITPEQAGSGPSGAAPTEPAPVEPPPAGDAAAEAPTNSSAAGVPAAGVPAARPGRAPWAKIRRIVLVGLAALALAAVVIFAIVGVPILQQKDATLTPPDRVAGLVRDDSDQAADTAEYLQAALAAEIDLDRTTGVVYNDPASTTRSVLFLGGTALLFTPEAELDRAFRMLADKAGSVSGVREVPAGDLGGLMKCGLLSSPDGDMAACAWADHGSVAVAMFPGRTVEQSAPLMRDLRSAIQKRS